MAIRTDVDIAWHSNPRRLTVANTSDELSIQDCVDTCRALGDTSSGVNYDYLLDASGKEDLGGGVKVGITADLNNLQVAFQARTASISEGTCTTADATGLLLIDSAATFETDGVAVGDVIMNFDDKSVATVLSVDSETQITHELLGDGTNNDWTSTDAYKIWPWEVCELSGGNAVAADENGSAIDVLQPRFGVSYVRTSASSATQSDLSAIQYASFGGGVSIDITRTGNHSTGTVYPAGNQEYPVNNIVDARAIAGTRFNQFFINSSMIGADKIDDAVDITGFHLTGKSRVNTFIEIDSALVCQNVTLCELNVYGTLDGGTRIVGCNVGNITYMNGEIEDCGMYGSLILSGSSDVVISNCKTIDQDKPLIIDMGVSGQSLAMPRFSGLVTIGNLNSATDEIGIGLDHGMVILEATITQANSVILAGIGMHINNSSVEVNTDGLISKQTIAEATWDTVFLDSVDGTDSVAFPYGTAGKPCKTIINAKAIAEANNIKHIHVHGNIILNDTFDSYIFTSDIYNLASIDLNNQSVNNITFQGVTLSGSPLSGEYVADNCRINSQSNIVASWSNCVINGGAFTVASGATLNGDGCNFTENTTFDLNGDGTLSLVKMSGLLTLANMTNAASRIAIAGEYILTSMNTITAGTMLVAGIGVHNNYTTGLTLLIDRTIPSSVWENDLTGYTADGTAAGIQVRLAYNDTVEMDILGGSSGSTHPIGLPGHAVNNFADAKTLLETYHLSKIRLDDDVVIPASANLNGITFISGKTIDRTITIPATATTSGTKFRDVVLTGNLNGRVEINNCQTEDLYNFCGTMTNTAVAGVLSLDDSTGQLATMDSCRTGGDGAIPDLHISGAKLSIVDWTGSLNIHDKTGTSILGISTSAGNFIVKNTCTAGMIIFAGIGTADKEDGTTSIVNTTNLVNRGNFAEEVVETTIEDSLNLEDTLRLILAATTGSSAGAGTGTFSYKSVDGVTTRIQSTFDGAGNRQITLLDAS